MSKHHNSSIMGSPRAGACRIRLINSGTKLICASSCEIRFFPPQASKKSLANSTEAEKQPDELGDRHRFGMGDRLCCSRFAACGSSQNASMVSAARALEYADGDRSLTQPDADLRARKAAYSRGDYANSAAALRNLIHEFEIARPFGVGRDTRALSHLLSGLAHLSTYFNKDMLINRWQLRA